ncbi:MULTISPECIES: hypothetical protein [unclassified Ruegeria]|uniref:hypothetical protein n=1 Tax=unclassified Ruegeria TaxID=2625375 RepID=UPI001ADA2439|nr:MULTISPECIES: hypothetical protein [unclassified Ruegeria]MBO9410357.1 hypothetical protein [Ruegeria sp. R8_1]MBO9414424.1 hypothetical protein [Ruegeria sp. R8_2]
MAHVTSAPRGATLRPDILIVIALAGVIGFSAGQNWPNTHSASVVMAEDWHGNVKRSTWPD